MKKNLKFKQSLSQLQSWIWIKISVDIRVPGKLITVIWIGKTVLEGARLQFWTHDLFWIIMTEVVHYIIKSPTSVTLFLSPNSSGGFKCNSSSSVCFYSWTSLYSKLQNASVFFPYFDQKFYTRRPFSLKSSFQDACICFPGLLCFLSPAHLKSGLRTDSQSTIAFFIMFWRRNPSCSMPESDSFAGYCLWRVTLEKIWEQNLGL